MIITKPDLLKSEIAHQFNQKYKNRAGY